MAPPDLKIGPDNGPLQPISTSRAVSRVTPVLPRAITEPDGNPLGRSGSGILDVLQEADELVARSRTPAVALDVGLEQARGAFVRNQPADALTLLDSVWEGARQLETGWYLRSGSLALLGLPAEAERLVEQALEFLPDSSALRFLQSLSRLALGDVPGARAAIEAVSGKASGDVLIRVQSALLLAKQGDHAGADQLLRQIIVATPEHPAVGWGRAMLRPTLKDGAVALDDAEPSRTASRTPHRSVTPLSVQSVSESDAPNETQAVPNGFPPGSGDLVGTTLRALGGRIPTSTPAEAIKECRNILVALASGGALANATSPGRAYAARTVLIAIIDALRNSVPRNEIGWDAESVGGQWQRAGERPGVESSRMGSESVHDLQTRAESAGKALQQTVRALVGALAEGRTRDAQQLVNSAGGSVESGAVGLLKALVGNDADSTASQFSRSPDGRVIDASAINMGRDGSIALPLRLGLALLPPDETQLHSVRQHVAHGATDRAVSWASAGLLADIHAPGGATPSAGLVALLLVILGISAFYNAHPLGAATAIVGATLAWSLRRTSRRFQR